MLGPDETLHGAVAEIARRFLEETADYWRDWVRDLVDPVRVAGRGHPRGHHAQAQRVRRHRRDHRRDDDLDPGGRRTAAATGTTAICWLRDAYFVVNALNRLNATRTMERYLGYIINVAAGAADGQLQPVYGISGRGELAGARGRHRCPAIAAWGRCASATRPTGRCSTTSTARRSSPRRTRSSTGGSRASGDEALFRRLERLGERALASVRPARRRPLGAARRAARAHVLERHVLGGLRPPGEDRARGSACADARAYWRDAADAIHASSASAPGTRSAAASSRRSAASARREPAAAARARLPARRRSRASSATVAAIERELQRGDFIFRYAEADDFGVPKNAFLVCTFWYVDALAALGRHGRGARSSSSACSRAATATACSPSTSIRARGELWGNFPQTYSMVGLINGAIRLSASPGTRRSRRVLEPARGFDSAGLVHALELFERPPIDAALRSWQRRAEHRVQDAPAAIRLDGI